MRPVKFSLVFYRMSDECLFMICPQCKWFKGKTELKTNKTRVIEQDGLTQRLVIHSATIADSGKYKCTFDDQSTFCNLTVKSKLSSQIYFYLFYGWDQRGGGGKRMF